LTRPAKHGFIMLQVYKSQYAANPFETMSEEEIERYKWEVEHKGQGQDGLATVEGKHRSLRPSHSLYGLPSSYCRYLTMSTEPSQPAES